MEAELDGIDKNGTWELIDLPSNLKPIRYKLFYNIKHRLDESIKRLKARLVPNYITR